MAKTPWRCSQCGTVNEPVANSCRTCGRWPSLFDLQDSAVGEVEQDGAAQAQLEVADHKAEEFEPEGFDPEEFDSDETEPDLEPIVGSAAEETSRRSAETRRRTARGRRQLVRLVIPIGVVLYLLITSYLNR